MDLEQIKAGYKNSSGILRAVLSPLALTYCVLTGKQTSRVHVWILDGKERHSGQPLTMAFSGTEQNKNYWARTAFDAPAEETDLGKCPPRRALRRLQACGKEIDLFAELYNLDCSPMPRSSSPLLVPVSVEGEMDIDSVNFSKKSIKKDLRKIEKGAFSYEIVTDDSYLKDFVETVYPSYLEGKYPGECLFETYQNLTRTYDRIEGLFIKKDGHRISGALLCYRGSWVDFKCQAVIPGYEELSNAGSTAAIDYFATVHFKANHWPHISLGGSRPFFHDGLLVWKKKWGLRLTRAGSLVQRLHLFNKSEGARSFLIQNPFISADRAQLTGVVFISGKEEMTPLLTKDLDSYDWPGIERVVVYCLDQVPATDPSISELKPDRIVFRSADDLFE